MDPSLSLIAALVLKLRMALDWALDVIFAKDFVQYLNHRSVAVSVNGDTSYAEPPIRRRCNTYLAQRTIALPRIHPLAITTIHLMS